MYKITRRFEFAMGHTLYQHPGKCAQLHGHNYLALITLKSTKLDDQGMVIDLGELGDLAKRIIDNDLDHRFLIYEEDPRSDALRELDPSVRLVRFNPTVENLAAFLKSRLEIEWQHPWVKVAGVQLWETENSYAEV